MPIGRIIALRHCSGWMNATWVPRSKPTRVKRTLYAVGAWSSMGKHRMCKIYNIRIHISYLTHDDTWLRWRPLWVRRFHQWVICQLLGFHVSQKRPQKVPNAILVETNKLKIYFITKNIYIYIYLISTTILSHIPELPLHDSLALVRSCHSAQSY